MDNKIDDEEDNSKIVLCKAMIRAEEAFFEYIEKDGQIDGAYFELKLIGYELDMDFERMNQVVMKTPEIKERKECECDINNFVTKSSYEDPNSSQYVGLDEIMTATSEQIEYGRKHNKWKLESESLLGECIMEPLTKEEMEIAKSFCNKEKNSFWLCMYQIARNKHKLSFMITSEVKDVMIKKCIICNKDINDDVIYCPYCGEFNSISGRNFEESSSDEIIQAMHEAEQRKLFT